MEIAGKLLYIFRRLREPSTHAALAGLFAIVGVHIPDETYASVMNGLAVLFGILGVFVSEAKPQSKIEGF